jgi:site-specific DNA-methyltransferase (adenine-specific)
MTIDEKTFKAMPPNLRALFSKLPNPGSEEVVGIFPASSSSSSMRPADKGGTGNCFTVPHPTPGRRGHDDNYSSASRFFYCAKASKQDRDEGCEALEKRECGRGTSQRCANCGKPIVGLNQKENCTCGNRVEKHTSNCNNHPTVKPTSLMRYLCRLITPPHGLILDPFMGSGSTGKAAILEGFNFVGIEKEERYMEIAKARIEAASKQEFLELDARGGVPH